MRTITKLEILGYQGQAVPNTLLRQERETRHLAMIFPGLGYSAVMPLLYYSACLLFAQGADVLRVEYNYQRQAFQSLHETEREQWFNSDVMAAWRAGVSQRAYQRITLIGKSIGTLALGHLLTTVDDDRHSEYIWFTPLLRNERLRNQMMQMPHRGLFIIGTADTHYDPALLAAVQQASGGESLVIDGVNHSLELGSNVPRSIQILADIIQALQVFLR